jgi:hypothetical protein
MTSDILQRASKRLALKWDKGPVTEVSPKIVSIDVRISGGYRFAPSSCAPPTGGTPVDKPLSSLRMNLQQLEYLVALDTHRQFGIAADKCFVTQPALSMQVQKLEDELGVRLFERNRRGVIPTRTGTKVIEQARLALRSIQQLREVVNPSCGLLVAHFL